MSTSVEQQVLLEVATMLNTCRQVHPQYPTDPIHAAAVVTEEAGELAQAVNDWVYDKKLYDPTPFVEQEALQTAASAVRFIVALRNGFLKANNTYKDEPAGGLTDFICYFCGGSGPFHPVSIDGLYQKVCSTCMKQLQEEQEKQTTRVVTPHQPTAPTLEEIRAKYQGGTKRFIEPNLPISPIYPNPENVFCFKCEKPAIECKCYSMHDGENY